MAGVDRTPFNQYDSIIKPVQEWLKAQNVQFEMGCTVTDLDFAPREGKKRLNASISPRMERLTASPWARMTWYL